MGMTKRSAMKLMVMPLLVKLDPNARDHLKAQFRRLSDIAGVIRTGNVAAKVKPVGGGVRAAVVPVTFTIER
jgi:hypothetical protein